MTEATAASQPVSAETFITAAKMKLDSLTSATSVFTTKTNGIKMQRPLRR